jgi:hypothetical protein
MVKFGGILNKGASPRSTRYFGRQFYNPRDVPEAPEATGFLRARLIYKYPRPWKCQDPEIWRHPDFLLPPWKWYRPQHPALNTHYTHICYTRNHVDRIQPEIILANPHLAPKKKP